MDKSSKEILQQFVDKLVPEIQAVTKRFAPSIEAKVTDTTATIYGSKYISTLIDGRAPTSSNAKKGSPTLQQILFEWAKSKGINPKPDAKGNIPTVEQMSWAMSISMHKKGDLLYQRVKNGGTPNNIFEDIITQQRIDNLLNLFEKKALNDVESLVKIN